MKLLSATPSPFARKVRVALIEKGIPFETVADLPWNPAAAAPGINPLGKVPVLILDDGRTLYDSKVIAEYVDGMAAPSVTSTGRSLIPQDFETRIAVRQTEALADGICDAVVLIVLERSRDEGLRSADWTARQHGKVGAGVRELARLLGDRTWMVGDGFTLADIAVGCTLGYLDLRLPELDWRTPYPTLLALFERLSARMSFAETVPAVQAIAAVR